jgi:hypothetical protein
VREPASVREPTAVREPASVREPTAVREPASVREPTAARKSASVRKPSPVDEPSAVREPTRVRKLSPVHEPSPVREPTRVRKLSPVHEPSAVREPTRVRKLSPVHEPSAARTPNPMRARINARTASAVSPAAVAAWDEISAPQPAPAPAPEPTLGVANFADDHYGDTLENLRVPAGIAGANALFWLVGRLFGVVELVGVAFFVSVGLLLAAYVFREWQRDRTSLICLAGAFPLPLTIISLFV